MRGAMEGGGPEAVVTQDEETHLAREAGPRRQQDIGL